MIRSKESLSIEDILVNNNHTASLVWIATPTVKFFLHKQEWYACNLLKFIQFGFYANISLPQEQIQKFCETG